MRFPGYRRFASNCRRQVRPIVMNSKSQGLHGRLGGDGEENKLQMNSLFSPKYVCERDFCKEMGSSAEVGSLNVHGCDSFLLTYCSIVWCHALSKKYNKTKPYRIQKTASTGAPARQISSMCSCTSSVWTYTLNTLQYAMLSDYLTPDVGQ